MNILIEISSALKKYTQGNTKIELELTVETLAIEAVKCIGIAEEEIGFLTVNGVKVDPQYVLKEGDILKAYPIIIGG